MLNKGRVTIANENTKVLKKLFLTGKYIYWLIVKMGPQKAIYGFVYEDFIYTVKNYNNVKIKNIIMTNF